ncbi:hypothetical protein [Sphingopyxis sp.]|uniref:hypothetical protein n=1 Tax=Sphingopyxis sp. TaxID=1908224 RepID=UPI002D76B843|nr:hypothetical protein [Sphingopyxis sp.]HET6526113.1 hypothetical protein [Sphingopyxis sp.]
MIGYYMLGMGVNIMWLKEEAGGSGAGGERSFNRAATQRLPELARPAMFSPLINRLKSSPTAAAN